MTHRVIQVEYCTLFNLLGSAFFDSVHTGTDVQDSVKISFNPVNIPVESGVEIFIITFSDT